jgi:hypothetical protein
MTISLWTRNGLKPIILRNFINDNRFISEKWIKIKKMTIFNQKIVYLIDFSGFL